MKTKGKKSMFAGLLLIMGMACVAAIFAQPPGRIFVAASPSMNTLDPNGDGWATVGGVPFSADDEGLICENIFHRIPLFMEEPFNDLTGGPSCGVTEIVDHPDAGQRGCAYVAYTPVDAFPDNGNDVMMFRIRCARAHVGGNFGYSILLDTDALLGFTGPDADPNAVAGNPGFEVEIRCKMAGGSGIFIDDVDGTTIGTNMNTLPLSTNYQQVYGLFNDDNCTDPAVFHDFFVPITDMGIMSTTLLRFLPATSLNGGSVLGGGSDDIGGIDDQVYGDTDSTLVLAITHVPTPPEFFIPDGQGFLPEIFASFTGLSGSGSINLNWEVGLGTGVTEFRLERSNPFYEMESLGSITFDGGPAYSLRDAEPFSGINYYKISAIDAFGNVTAEDYMTINFQNPASLTEMTVFPNPSSGEVNIQVTNPNKEHYVISIYNSLGQEIITKGITSDEEIQLNDFSYLNLKSGAYQVAVKFQNGERKVSKLIIER